MSSNPFEGAPFRDCRLFGDRSSFIDFWGWLAAQEAPSRTKAQQLGEVVVTASRVQTNLQKTPIAVTAISGEALMSA